MLVHFLMFIHKIGGKRGTGAEHEHGFVQAYFRCVLIQEGMPNTLFIVCIAIEFQKCRFKHRMIDHASFFERLQCRTKCIFCF